MSDEMTDPTTPTLEEVIDRVLLALKDMEVTSPDFARTVEQLDKLKKMQTPAKEKRQISMDTLLTVGANLAGIALILGFEKANVVTSKALGFVLKSKI